MELHKSSFLVLLKGAMATRFHLRTLRKKMLDLWKGQLRFWRMEFTKTSRGRKGAERMQPAGSRKGKKPALPRKIGNGNGNCSTGSDSLIYCFKMGKKEKDETSPQKK